jgi:hypothetical protein
VIVYIWRVLLGEAQEWVDELLERGERPRAADVVACVLAAHPFVEGIDRYRLPLCDEVENYLSVSAASEGEEEQHAEE